MSTIQAKPYVATLVEFLASEIDHWAFRDAPMDQQQINQAIAKYPSTTFASAQKEQQEAINRLLNEGLLRVQQTWFPDQIKFYIAIADLGPGMASFRGAVQRRIESTTANFAARGQTTGGLKCISFYRGRGFASTLVKGVAPGLSVLMDFALHLRLILSEYSLNTATFIIGGLVCGETDHIQLGSLNEEFVFDSNVYSWIPELYAPGRPQVTAEKLRGVEAYLERTNLFHSLDFNSRLFLGRLVVALVREPVSEATGAPVASDILSSWFRETESWFRRKIEKYVVALAGGDSKRQAQISQDVQLPRGGRYEALGQVIQSVLSLVNYRYSGQEFTAPFLSPSELTVLNQASNLRNMVQHNDTAYLEDWRKTVDTMADCLPIFSKLRHELEDMTAGWEQHSTDASGSGESIKDK